MGTGARVGTTGATVDTAGAMVVNAGVDGEPPTPKMAIKMAPPMMLADTATHAQVLYALHFSLRLSSVAL